MGVIGSERMRSEFEDITTIGIAVLEDGFVGLQDTLSYDTASEPTWLTRSIASIHDLMDSLFPYICLPGIGHNPTSRRYRGTSEEGKIMSTMSES